MKKIIPFNNVLQFNTDVKEITAISLEHEIEKNSDVISGVFYISGEYKMTDGQLDREPFNFELPFDIALSNNYRQESLLVDIDDFRYELISDKSLKVNIDLYIDGEVEEPLPRNNSIEVIDIEDTDKLEQPKETITEEKEETDTELVETICEEINDDNEITPERIDLLKDMLTDDKEKEMEKEININNTNTNETNNENINNNIFDPIGEDNYVTYRVYKVLDTDTIDTILTKYNITKELLADYNNIENINPGDKLIIPTNEK